MSHWTSLPFAKAKTRPAAVGVVGACLAVVTLTASQKSAPPPRTAFVELDAVVMDDNDQPVRGLRRNDFRITEDGGAIEVTSFAEVSAAAITGRADSLGRRCR